MNNKQIDVDAFTEAARELAAAVKAHAEASQKESLARSELTNATNNLNRAQKAFDLIVNGARAAAPWNTDWHNDRGRGNRAAE